MPEDQQPHENYPSKLNKYSFIVYQFLLLLVMVGFLGWEFYISGTVNELILGVLLGMMIGIPVPGNWPDPYRRDDRL